MQPGAPIHIRATIEEIDADLADPVALVRIEAVNATGHPGVSECTWLWVPLAICVPAEEPLQ